MLIEKSQIKKVDMNNNPNINKPAIASSTVTRDLRELDIETGNIYESLVIMSKRANQISNNIKEELHQKLSEFASSNDNLEEVFENREQIEISKYYEKLPKPSLVAVQEFLDGKIYYRNPSKEQ
ncbi:MAG: polymerase Rpb6 [Mucilaginibacter sp.]|nr:polymerase Rpb6 [Mucilaginibacter sp.]